MVSNAGSPAITTQRASMPAPRAYASSGPSISATPPPCAVEFTSHTRRPASVSRPMRSAACSNVACAGASTRSKPATGRLSTATSPTVMTLPARPEPQRHAEALASVLLGTRTELDRRNLGHGHSAILRAARVRHMRTSYGPTSGRTARLRAASVVLPSGNRWRIADAARTGLTQGSPYRGTHPPHHAVHTAAERGVGDGCGVPAGTGLAARISRPDRLVRRRLLGVRRSHAGAARALWVESG